RGRTLRRGGLAGRVEKPADWLSSRGKVVIYPRRLLRLRDMRLNATRLEMLERLEARLEHEAHAASEDNGSGAVLKQLLDVGHLDARHVMRSGLSPVPRTAAARPELQVVSSRQTVCFDLSPDEMRDRR